MTSCLLAAVGKNGNVFFLNENASSSWDCLQFSRNALCTVDLGGKGGTSLSSSLVPDLISGKVWGRQTDREEFLPERCL